MKKIFLLIAFISLSLSVFSAKFDLKRVEPTNWWTGMKHPELQMLLYGENISAYRPEITYPGVTIERIVTTVNPNYIFLYLNVSADTKAGSFDILFKDGKKTAGKHSYTLLERREGSAEREGFNSSDAMYLLMPDRFANGNPDNDSHPDVIEKVNRADKNGRHGGDIQGVIDHLDYISDLGFTALWSTPMMEDNVPTFSYHTYAISDYYKIDPRYGTNEDYKRLSAEARKRGIKLVMDVVTNHCGIAHWWMKDLPTPDWVHQFDQFTRSNYRIGTITDPYASNYDYELNEKGWFDHSMPDMNQSNPLVIDYFIYNTIWWIEYADLGGLRIDTYPYNDKFAMAYFCRYIMEEYPQFNIVGECWVHQPLECAYWQEGVKNSDGYVSYLPTVMDFPLTDALAPFAQGGTGWGGGIEGVYYVFSQDYSYYDPFKLLIFGDNHDTERLWTSLGNDVNKFKLVFTVLSTVRGIPQVYYGTEIRMGGQKQQGDGDIRRDFPGGWQGDSQNAFTRKGRTAEQNEVFDFVHKLLNWRKGKTLIHNGNMLHFIPENECYVYFRYDDKETVMVAINTSDKEEKTLSTARFKEILGTRSSGKDIISGKEFDLSKSITIPAKSAFVIEVNK
ncbi:MAG: glycoside hydrolase family 13 protein [Culturomica sp.]|jgi:glycosidase|nr:glycoside hydrolase family 13 protein [Culturomica sp.]